MSTLQKALVLDWIKYKSNLEDLKEISKICENRAKRMKDDIHTLVLKYFGELKADYEKINDVLIYVTYFTDYPSEYHVVTDSSWKYCFRNDGELIQIWIADLTCPDELLRCNVYASAENSIITEHCPTHGEDCEMERGLHRTQLIPKIVHIATVIHPQIVEYYQTLQRTSQLDIR
jgi:hypothetical protein